MAHSSNEYMKMWWSRRKAKYDLLDKCEKDIQAQYVKEPTGDFEERSRIGSLNTLTWALLFKTGQKTRKMHNLDDIYKIYNDLWKELETQEAILKEIR